MAFRSRHGVRPVARGLPVDRRALVVACEGMGEGLVSLTLDVGEPFEVSPGQFILLRDLRWGRDPLLGRPFAVAWSENARLGILFHVQGRGTEALSRLGPGDEVQIRGPQGRGFPDPEGNRLVLVAGAMGVAPLLAAWRLYSSKVETELFLGLSCRSWGGLLQWLQKRGVTCRVACDDGSLGRKGTVVDLLKEHLREKDEVWACGPRPMLAAVASLEPDRLSVSLEARMACGYGGCLGCVVPLRSGPLRVCVDGPVFDGKEVLWDELPC